MKKLENFFEFVFYKQRWVIHLLFWSAILILYSIFFGRKNSNYLQTFFFVGLLMPVTVATTYLSNYYLVPRYLMKELYGRFLLYFIYILLVALFLEMMIAMLTFVVMAKVKIRDMSPASIDMFFLLTSLLMVVFLAIAIKLLIHWRTSKVEYDVLMRDKVEAELKFLKTQLNPHFLFNTLNNLYFLTTTKSDSASAAILQLSEILDYAMQSSKTIMVPLTNELKQAQNYIALEMLRYEDRVTINEKIDGELNGRLIPPMILITLLENSFKHGVMPSAIKSWISYHIIVNTTSVDFIVANSKYTSSNGNGIGLNNLSRQLSHLYGEQFKLQIKNDTHEFLIHLTLNHQ